MAAVAVVAAASPLAPAAVAVAVDGGIDNFSSATIRFHWMLQSVPVALKWRTVLDWMAATRPLAR